MQKTLSETVSWALQYEAESQQTKGPVVQVTQEPALRAVHLQEDGGTCFSVDEWWLNDVTRKDAYPLLWIDETFGALKQVQNCSVLLISSAGIGRLRWKTLGPMRNPD